MWMKTTCGWENLRPYQASVCARRVLENQGGRSLAQDVRNRLGLLKVCLQMKYFYIFIGIGKPVSFPYTLSCCFRENASSDFQSRSAFNMHLVLVHGDVATCYKEKVSNTM